jgi:two-component system chemotaxis family response regulator WspR
MAALRTVDLTSVDLVICRAKLPDATGVEVIAHLRTHHPDVPVILTSCFDGALSPAEAIRAGAIDFVLLDDAAFRTLPLAVAKCLEHQRIKRENDRLHAELSCSLAELEIKNRQFEAVIEHLELMTRTDGLTGLANRRWLDLRLEAVWAEATRCDHPMALMMIDLDDFKLVNDRLGHLHGDELLRLAARVLQANSRAMDTSARYGGDELCLVMPHIRLEDAINVARRITSEFAHAADSSDEAGMIGVGMSVGVAHIDASRPVNAMQLIRHADEALCAAKTNGKGQIMVRLGTAAVPDDEALVAVAPADERRSRT